MASSDIAGGGPPPPPKTSFWDKLAAKAKEVGEQTKEKAIDLKLAADDQLEKARQSDAWQKTKEGAGQAWDKTKVAAMQAHSQVKTAIQGEKKVVTFTETKLGMTLARDDRSVSFHAKHTKNKVSIFFCFSIADCKCFFFCGPISLSLSLSLGGNIRASPWFLVWTKKAQRQRSGCIRMSM